MTDMKHGRPEDEFGINSTAELFGKIEDKDQDSFVLQEKPVRMLKSELLLSLKKN